MMEVMAPGHKLPKDLKHVIDRDGIEEKLNAY